jgi:hypothetical protein
MWPRPFDFCIFEIPGAQTPPPICLNKNQGRQKREISFILKKGAKKFSREYEPFF